MGVSEMDEAEQVLQALASMGEHRPELVYFDKWHVETPAEVCWGCSDPEVGRWVPASFCSRARALLPPVGGVSAPP
jgi:hypothetical protein